MSKIIIEKKICLEPNLLDEKLHDHLMKKINSDFLGLCDGQYGYIIKIYNKIQILDNIISSCSPAVFFRVKFAAKVEKPKEGSEYEGVVCMVFQNGIFVRVFDKMKVLISSDKLNECNYKYDKANSTYKKHNKTISKDDIVKLKIDKFEYKNQNFNCIGSLKE